MLLITVILIVFGIILIILALLEDYWYESFVFAFGVFILLIALSFIIAMPISKWSTTDFIKSVEATQITIEKQRENSNLTEYERAMLTNKITEINQEIAIKKNRYKKWRSKYWLVPEIMDLDFIE